MDLFLLLYLERFVTELEDFAKNELDRYNHFQAELFQSRFIFSIDDRRFSKV